jgi:hypothetical protein
MRLFQSGYFYPAYLPHFRELSRRDTTFAQAMQTLLADRTDASHILQPILAGDDSAFYTRSSDRYLQTMWAREHGMSRRASDDEILLAQIEEHRTEVFYDMGPMLRGPDFLKRLPGSVKKTITWFAAPDPCPNLDQYDLVVGNFPSLAKQHEERGCRTAQFSPAHDPALDAYAANQDRPVDVLFVGSYSQHHGRRNALLFGLVGLAGEFNIAIHLHASRRVRLAESLLGRMSPLAKEGRPEALRTIAKGPLFGRNLYAAMSRAKICVNGSVGIAGNERGNMRCFESMGARNLLLSDEGVYPEGMVSGRTLATYSSGDDAIAKLRELLAAPEQLERIAGASYEMISSKYSKKQQWEDFQSLVA